MGKDIPCERKPKGSQRAILISEKQIDFKIKNIIRDKEGHCIMIKGSIQEEDITIVNIYTPNIGASKYIRQTLTGIRQKIYNNIITVGDFNTPLTSKDRSSRQRINKETLILNETLGWMDLIDIFRTFHPNVEEYTIFSSAGTFSRIDHIFDHKFLSKFKKIEIISSIFSDHVMRLDINYGQGGPAKMQIPGDWTIHY